MYTLIQYNLSYRVARLQQTHTNYYNLLVLLISIVTTLTFIILTTAIRTSPLPLLIPF